MIATISFALLVVLALAYVMAPLLTQRADDPPSVGARSALLRQCQQCGAPADGTAAFCTRCGAALERT